MSNITDELIKLGLYLHEHNISNRQFYFNLTYQTNRNSTSYIEENEQEPFTPPCTLFLDQSTNTGYAIFDSKTRLVTSGEFFKSISTSVGRYKFALKDFINLLIKKYTVETVYYEHVYDEASPTVTEVLNSIKFMIQDLELERELQNKTKIDVYGVDHAIWKKELAKPNTFKRTKNDKKEVLRHIEFMYPLLVSEMPKGRYLENMFDAIGMGIGLIVKQTYSGMIYKKLRYNKTLPLDQILITNEKLPDFQDKEDIEKFIQKLRKPFREAYKVDRFHIVDSDEIESKHPDELVRRFLTHKDCVHFMKIPLNYRYWGLTLLHNNISTKDDGEDTKWYLISARRNRLL